MVSIKKQSLLFILTMFIFFPDYHHTLLIRVLTGDVSQPTYAPFDGWGGVTTLSNHHRGTQAPSGTNIRWQQTAETSTVPYGTERFIVVTCFYRTIIPDGI
jgi:hypothetical protein